MGREEIAGNRLCNVYIYSVYTKVSRKKTATLFAKWNNRCGQLMSAIAPRECDQYSFCYDWSWTKRKLFYSWQIHMNHFVEGCLFGSQEVCMFIIDVHTYTHGRSVPSIMYFQQTCIKIKSTIYIFSRRPWPKAFIFSIHTYIILVR